jgi:cytoskeletal protein CcmA (bactofilin family)
VIRKREDRRGGYVEVPDVGEEGRRMADRGEGVTVVGPGASLEGTIVSAGPLHVDGQVKGRITAEGDVTLGSQSQVEADIRAQNVSIGGRFTGAVVVTGRAAITRSGRVEGAVTSKTLVIEEGALFRGQSIMEQGKAHAVPPQQADPQAPQEAKV